MGPERRKKGTSRSLEGTKLAVPFAENETELS